MKKFTDFLLSRKGILLILLVMLIAGFLLRYPLVSRTDFWSDEAFTGTLLREDWKTMFQIVIQDKVHPPVYYLFLKTWGLIFGYKDTTLRMFSVVFGMILIPLSYVFGTKLSEDKRKSKLIGLALAFLVTVSPFFVVYSVENRSYSMLMVFAAIMALTFDKALKTSPLKLNRWWWITIILGFTNALIHYMGVVYFGLYILVYVVFRLIENGTIYKAKFWQKTLVATLGLYVFGVWLASTSLIGKVLNRIKERMPWIPDSTMVDSIKSIYAFLFGVDRQAKNVPPVLESKIPIQYMNIAVIILILLLASVIYYMYKQRHNKKELFQMSYLLIFSIGSLALISLGTDFGVNMYVERYLSISGWFLLVLIAVLAVKVWGKWAILACGIYLILLSQTYLPPRMHTYSNTANYIDTKMSAKHVFTCDSGTMILMDNYLSNYKSRLLFYAPNTYDVYSKITIFTIVGVRKDFADAVPGDAFICPDVRSLANMKFLTNIEGMNIYQFK